MTLPPGLPDDADELRWRLRGLKPAQAASLRRAMALVTAGDRLLAGQLFLELDRAAPGHPEVARWRGIGHFTQGEWADAVDCLARAALARPDDFAVQMQLAAAQDRAGDFEQARQSLLAAGRAARGAAQWLALGLECDRQGHHDQALVAVDAVLQLAPGHAVALLQRARCHKALGKAEAAAADCRALISRGELAARAWFSLVDLKTLPLTAQELAALEHAASQAVAAPADRMLLDFALGKALEDAGRHAQAYATLARANLAVRATLPWHAEAFTRHVMRVQQVFDAAPAAAASGQGGEVVFLVGLPRSGTTLVEQVLASHSRVEGASELPYLRIVIDEESRRRGQAFPDWVPAATATDWARLGQHYLQLSRRWRLQRPVSTDKLPDNWLLAGAALAMLPGSRVIDCRRDAVETCWSCYKQLFGPGQVGYTYGLDTLAAYWRDCDRLCRFWAARCPAQFRSQHYEALVADPEGQIRALLDFCGLPFEPACLDFHRAPRAIRTPSALQVRQPLRRVSTPAAAYGVLLDPLREALAAAGAHVAPRSGG